MRKTKKLLAWALSASICLTTCFSGGVVRVHAEETDAGAVESPAAEPTDGPAGKIGDEEDLPVSADYFPDEGFLAYVKANISGAEDEVLTPQERNNVTSITISSGEYTVKDITGIEYFKELEYLSAEDNLLKDVDLKGNVKLQNLDLYSNTKLTSLDISACTELRSLNLYNCKLSSLNVDGLTKLTSLDCSNNQQLRTLDVSTCTGLTTLNAYSCKLNSLNVSGLTNLDSLSCYSNQLKALDVSGLTNLTSLSCESNQIKELDISGLTKLTYLTCNDNQLSNIDVSKLTELTYLNCGGNQLVKLDVGGLTELTSLGCGSNQLTSLDVSNLTKLTNLDCWGNQLTGLDIGNLTELSHLNCSDNKLASLDLNKCTQLRNLYCSNNQITSLDLSALTELTDFSCYYNQIEELDISRAENLAYADFGYNKLWSLNTVKNDALKCNYLSDPSNEIAWSMRTRDYTLTEQEDDGTWILDLSKEAGYQPGTTQTASKYSFYESESIWDTIEKPTFTEKGLVFASNPFDKLGESVSEFSFGLRYDLSNDSYLDDTYLGIPVRVLKEEVAPATVSTASPEKLNQEIELSEENFPDKNFRKYLKDSFDGDGDDKVRLGDVTSISMDWGGLSIKSLAGIELFTELTDLSAPNNLLTELDLSQNPYLNGVTLSNNVSLKSLKVSTGGALTQLEVSNCALEGLDVSGLTGLTNLQCFDNKLIELNVTGLTRLESLNCGYNQLTSLDVGSLKRLRSLGVAGNKLAELDVSGLTELTDIDCGDNKLTELDVSALAKLQDLRCCSNNIKALDLKALTELRNLDCSSNKLTELDISSLFNLSSLNVNYNNLWSLDTSGNESLKPSYMQNPTAQIAWYMDQQKLAIEEQEDGTWLADLSGMKGYTPGKYTIYDYSLGEDADKPQITKRGLEWSYDPLEKYGYSSISLTLLYDLSNDEYMDGRYMAIPLYLQKQLVNQEDIDRPVSLTKENFPDEKFREYLINDFDQDGDGEFYPGQITYLDVNNRSISDLTGIKYFVQLQYLYCDQNELTVIDVSGLAELRNVSCVNNHITELNISGCTLLSNISAWGQTLGAVRVEKTENGSYIAKSDVLKEIQPKLSSNPDEDVVGQWYWNGDSFDDMSVTEDGWTWTGDPLQGKYAKNIEIRKIEKIRDDYTYTYYLSMKFINTYEEINLEPVAFNEKNFPDKAFRDYLKNNSYVSYESTEPVINPWEFDNIGIYDSVIEDLTGIEYFTELTSLTLNGLSQLTNLDLSANTKLTQLDVSRLKGLHTLDLSTLDQLSYLNTGDTPLYAVKLSPKAPIKTWFNTSVEMTAQQMEDGSYVLQIPEEMDLTDPRVFNLDENLTDGVFTWEKKEDIPRTISYRYLFYDDYDALQSYTDVNQYMTVTISLTNNTPEPPEGKKVPLNETNFPDDGFRAYLKKNYANGSDTLNTADVTLLGIFNYDNQYSITNLKGIELLNCLSDIHLDNVSINKLLLTDNPVLTSISTYNTSITELDVKGCMYLDSISIDWGGALPELDVSNNKYLTSLNVPYNSLNELDLSKNKNLKYLNCRGNALKTLDLSNNKKLQYLECNDNQLTSLNITGLSDLQTLQMANNKLPAPDLSSHSGLQSLEMSAYYDYSEGTPERESLDLSGLTGLTRLWLQGYDLTVDFGSMTKLTELSLNECKIPDGTLDFQKAADLRYLQIGGYNNYDSGETPDEKMANGMDINVSGLKKLRDCSIYGVTASRMDASGCISLNDLSCTGLGIQELNIKGDVALRTLYCSDNKLNELDVSDNVALQNFYCENNNLSEIDITKNKSLKHFQCNNNPITNLDLSNNKSLLEEVYCNNAALTSLDVDENEDLSLLEVENQEIRIPYEEITEGESGSETPEASAEPAESAEPAPDGKDILVTAAPSDEDVSVTAAPSDEDVPVTAAPADEDVFVTAAPSDEDVPVTAAPADEDISVTAAPEKKQDTDEDLPENREDDEVLPAGEVIATEAPTVTEVSAEEPVLLRVASMPDLQRLFALAESRPLLPESSRKKAGEVTLNIDLTKYGRFDASKVSDLSTGELTKTGITWSGSANSVPESITYQYDVSNKYKLRDKKMPVKIWIGGAPDEEPEQPAVTKAPVASVGPTSKPVSTKSPAASTKPTSKPTNTKAPAASMEPTSQPASTKAPVASLKPVSTPDSPGQSVSTDAPQESLKPVSSPDSPSQPVDIDTPKESTEPISPDSPSQPVDTEAPKEDMAPTGQPGTSGQPTDIDVPEESKKPADSPYGPEQPAVTNTPDESRLQTAEPYGPGQPTDTDASQNEGGTDSNSTAQSGGTTSEGADQISAPAGNTPVPTQNAQNEGGKDSNASTAQPNVTPVPTDEPEETDNESEEEEKSSTKTTTARVGSTISSSSGTYKVKAGKTLVYTGTTKKNAKKVQIPSTIKKNGVTYKVTEIKASAFKENKSLQTVVISKEIKKIGAKAFYGCSNLKKITIQTTKLTHIGGAAFKNISSNAKFTCPAGKAKSYKKLIVKGGAPKGAKIK